MCIRDRLHLTHFLRKQAREFIGISEVQWMVERLKPFYPALVEELTPKPLSLQQLTEILQRLVEEHVSIRDLKSVFQALSQWARNEQDIPTLAEQVRVALKEKICHQLTDGRPVLFVYQLDPEIEDMFRNSIRQSAIGPYVAMETDMIERIMEGAHGEIGSLPATAQRPVILTDSDIRRFVKRLLDHRFPDVTVLSYEQLSPKINLQPLGAIALPAPHAELAAAQ